MLLSNKTLRKLELEGNQLGLQSAYAFGRALKQNTTLKFLDLESNQLTTDGTVWGGVTSLIEFLSHNKTLLSLNLANNGMDDSCGSNFRELLQDNFTLIDFDFSMNNFTLEDSRTIQDLLMRNKALYDENRIREWRERKAMRSEDEALKELFLQEQSKKEQGKMEEEAREIREKELEQKWKKFMLETEIEKQQII